MRAEPRLQPIQGRELRWHLLGVFATTLLVYAFTAPRGIALEDDGNFVMAAHFLGIAHPPGYPLYVLLAKPFTWLPIGSIAFRVHLASAVFGAGACSALWWIVRSLVPSTWIAYAVALAFAFSEVMWAQSIIADVYSLNLLLFLSLFAVALAYLQRPSKKRLALMAFVYGLGLSNHWPLLVLATPCLALVLWPERRQVLRGLPLALPALILGLTPYLWMVLRSHTEPELSFYGPIRNLKEFLFFASRRGYMTGRPNYTAGGWDKLQYAGFLLQQCATQLSLLGGAVAVCGALWQWRHWRVSWSLALLAGLLSGGFAIVPLQNVDYDFLEQLQYRVFPLIPYAILALWLASGLYWLEQRAATRWPDLGPRLISVLGGLLVLFLLASNWQLNNRRSYRLAEDYGRTLLESLEPNAILFSFHDFDAFPLGYLNLVEDVRADVELYHRGGLVFPSRLFHALAPAPEKREKIRQLLNQTPRPVYYINEAPEDYARTSFGFYTRLHGKERTGPSAEPAPSVEIREDLLALAQRMNSSPDLGDSWSLALRNSSLSALAGVLMIEVMERPESQQAERYRSTLAGLRASYYGLVGQLHAASHDASSDAAELLEWVHAAEAMQDETVPKRHRAELLDSRGRVLLRLGREEEALASFQRSLDVYPHPENLAVMGALRLLASRGERSRYLELRQRYFENRIGPSELLALDRQVEVD